jgi:uroporphyrinogen-III decarboxylase
MAMADQLLAARVDLLLYVDPTQEKSGLAAIKAKFGGRLALAGGISSAITLYRGTREEIRQAVHTAIQELGPSGFILAPVSSLTPDIPWPNVEAMIEAWREVRGIA